ncbi:MAG: 30S ribosomal protein S16 [Firmicutes bacterium]|nr:30S ribosomal protein S16 [Bacillota bacterium]
MVKIRLRRMGAKKAPSYRLVVADSRKPRDGRFIEAIGHYNPTREPVIIEIDEEKAVSWLSRGAQPSGTVLRLFKQVGVWDKFLALKGQNKETAQA